MGFPFPCLELAAKTACSPAAEKVREAIVATVKGFMFFTNKFICKLASFFNCYKS
jgi:hypothetical protein